MRSFNEYQQEFDRLAKEEKKEYDGSVGKYFYSKYKESEMQRNEAESEFYDERARAFERRKTEMHKVQELVNKSKVVKPYRIGESRENINPAVTEVIDWFKQQGGNKWLRGITEKGLLKFLLRLSEGQGADIPVWNCFNFYWRQNKSGEYPACIISDDVDESIVVYNFRRLQEAIGYLSLLGPITPVILIPTNEANAPVWKYIQTKSEREIIVTSTAAKLKQKLGAISGDLTLSVMRWDDYLVSRGIRTEAEIYSVTGTNIIEKNLPEKRKVEMIKDDQAYFEQFGMTISRQESAKRIPHY